jgi:two-component system response regulator AtoC
LDAPSDHPLEIVIFSRSGVSVRTLAPGAELSVGRDAECAIVLDDFAVSRRHAVFHGGPPAEIEDLGSSNGTYVTPVSARAASGATGDQKRLSGKRMALAAGDTVSIGGALAVVREARAADAQCVVGDPAMVALYEQAARAARAALPILLVGETGVGKDVLARFIHQASPRKDKPFLALNCAAISEGLFESELFGHERGAFTGAQQAREGLFEAAHGGTLFLDEIGELPLATQAKLLRALESGEITRVGSTKPRRVDVRFVAATNADLEKAANNGAFRKDLYFRVNGLTLAIPPLRARRGEIADLARRFMEDASRRMNLPYRAEFAPAALEALSAHDWPGNIRELRNVVERAVALSNGNRIGVGDLPSSVRGGARAPSSKERVVQALAECNGNQTRAAELLGVSRRTLINRMIEYDLPRPRKDS